MKRILYEGLCITKQFLTYSKLCWLTVAADFHFFQRNAFDNYPPSSAASYLYPNDFSDSGKSETLIEGWDIVEHSPLPPPPSQTEDVEHWTRAMFIDATKK